MGLLQVQQQQRWLEFGGGDSIYSTENIEGRLVMPDEVANIAKVLVSSAGDMIVGETIHISGGRGIFDIR